MKNQRKIHSAEFKARIALEALKGLQTVQQIAAENGIHPVQVTQWKREMQDGATTPFARDRRLFVKLRIVAPARCIHRP